MSERQAILAKLRESKNAAVERILDRAMAMTPKEELGELANVLLERDRRAGWVALIRHFENLGEELQKTLIERPRQLFGPLAESADENAGESRSNVIQIVKRSADAKLVYLLAQSLMDSRQEVRQMAADSLLDAIQRYRRDGKLSPTASEGEQENLQRAVDFALTHQKTHKQQNALHAALIFERKQDGATWLHFADQHSDAARAGNLVLRGATDPLLAAALMLALASPLKPAAIHGLAHADGAEMIAALAKESFRLMDPLVARGAGAIGNMKILGSLKRETPWTKETWPEFLRLIEAIGLPEPLKVAWLARMAEGSETPAAQRMMAVIAASKIEAPEALTLLAAHVADADERVARVAARALLWRKRNDARQFADAFNKTPHESVKRMATAVLGTTKFEKHWKDYQKLPPVVQANTTRTLAVQETDFASQLRAKLESPDAGTILQALRYLASLGDIKPFHAKVVALCQHPESRVAASAVKLVGKMGDAAQINTLEEAAKHGDARVRANAVEAMDQLRIANQSKEVLALLDSRFNRERANAIKAISNFDMITARQTLTKMLADPNPMHRVSALWVVEQLAIFDIVRQVTTLARRDHNPHVRARALEMLARVAHVAQLPSQAG